MIGVSVFSPAATRHQKSYRQPKTLQLRFFPNSTVVIILVKIFYSIEKNLKSQNFYTIRMNIYYLRFETCLPAGRFEI